ncbi:mannose-1-phosphate guanylyltransferase/mannose-6-phosphate isomerase [Sulfitobacter sp. M57]|uniref:mannose-1-phosphate guanylyltransferase/mannose-6-phosphate isomerase n=1 Tax=unclassified Sulfitobacter TaxID=196795 RepID=UPI0023E2E22C|nr:MULTISPECIES: mannose-1-phosphate guanylyltransferase/mannose-6-phosphate isomerase [unclassified Sulfitobacter]MDF3415058.1 mannose-1-phosphate guanylyltransferase/mannose-6-phosphate isomerase [Sulfitobacter sp. KE5]MDF3422539.1 mannose-1-phosphate guanylyltransferase/mannose-6-phosphate isomerase [Sulfitobacter sp. KE43]MDF3433604.1 mannose-1-phosphate guanylyltransferase/mannose-6-phosphate isomerase [Sulfitobacter sp. KE42]MDF3459244.1 mannose-1-phosphate guanylyltransferase/mannose-6-p
MTTSDITPVILCGGSGTRLWPVSRKSFPKQFIDLIGEGSLFQQSSKRLSASGFAEPIVVTNSDFRFIATQQLHDAGITPNAVLIEPEARNTAPALLAAALVVAQKDPAQLMLAAPSDHYITQADVFCENVRRGVAAAQAGQIVTFGITPNKPETGYGYLELGEGEAHGALPLKRFVEKPQLAEAQRMLDAGGYLWNAGIFMYAAQTMIDAFATHAPDMLAHVRAAVEAAEPDLGFLRLDPAAWANCEDISVDFAIMEKVSNLSVIAHTGDWSDMGGWNAVHLHAEKDADGVALQGRAHAVECKETLLRSESGAVQLVGLGLENIVAVAMPDAVLVANRSCTANLGDVVKQMRAADVPQADNFPKDHRPWGFFETLILSDGFQVKRIVVNPGAALSLQSHEHRSEHWIVVVGTAKVTVGPDRDNLDVKMVHQNESVYIPLHAIHRMENPGDTPMELIEVQTGSYLGEDDIVRYEDVYSRGQGAKG